MSARIKIDRNPEPMGAQVEAITNLEQNLIISAGAGSGKTWVLTERYLEILSRGYSPAQIVAITFTRKAAGEMKGRIRQAIQKMAREAKQLEEQRYWEQCEREFKQSIITTIDGFCSELLRTHPLEAGLSPQFQVFDSIEADLIKSDIYTQTIRQLLDREPVADEFVMLYQELSSIQAIVSHALALDHQLKTYYKTPQDIREETIAAIDGCRAEFQRCSEALLVEIDGLLEELKEEVVNAKQKRAYMDDIIDWIRRYDALRESLAVCDGEADDTLYEGLVDLHWNRWRAPGRGAIAELTRTLRQEKLNKLFACILPARYRRVVDALLTLVDQAEQRYAAYKQREQAVDFHDIEIATARLLERYPEICERWQKRISFLMIDEFQDTNELQKSIFDRLSDLGQKMRLFVVGDGKQSIYRFRGADIEVFYDVEQEIVEQKGLKLSLSRNFRSQHGVIEYINSLFEHAMQRTEESPAFVTRYEQLEAHRVTEKEEPHIEFLCTTRKDGTDAEASPEDEDELTGVEEQADLIARRIKQMVNTEEPLVWREAERGQGERPTPVSYGDVAVLLATRSKMHLYEFAFQEYDIPYVVIGGRQYYEKQEILDLLNLLRMLQNEDDEVSLLAFLRSPFAQLTDETLFWLTRNNTPLRHGFHRCEQKPEAMEGDQWKRVLAARERVTRWRRQKGWQTAAELLEGIIKETGYRMMLSGDKHGDQQVANVDKFTQLIQRLVDEKGYPLYDIVQHFNRLQEEEIQEEEASVVSDHGNAVVIMSVHASKGLEFSVVFIPELEKDQLRKGGQATRFFYNPRYGAGLRLKELGSGKGADGPGHGMIKKMKEDEEEREKQEGIRLLYVAMTRAKDHLVLFATEWSARRKPSFSWLGLFMEHLGWSELADRESVETEDWRLSVLNEQQIPVYPKKSERRSRLEAWLERSEPITNRHLPEFPLMPQPDQAYRWLANKPGAHLPRLSASAFMQYESCQRKFYLQYIAGIYDLDELLGARIHPTSQETKTEQSLSGAERGALVHHLLEVQTGADFMESDHEERWRQAVVTMLERQVDAAKAYEEIRPYLQAYQSFMTRQSNAEYETEKSLTYLWDGHPIYGQLDRIVYHPDGEITIVDFKTNRIQGSVASAAEPYHLQGYLYVELAEKALQRKVKAMTFVFLEQDKEYDLPLDERNRIVYRQKIDTLLSELRMKTEQADYVCCGQSGCVCRYTNESLLER
ncbi:hypothetical protein BEP19_08745 [Ammoniphilus oxalaticus]|uniref:DNA 3'-5' helicase n=1 Tax=Ammoniphilus oxalaticus TaxID=66863 RepID=A0A419SKG5_9BACL|nr:UvrD-helicase domain-containing protein [Ammoniphilus oxalaticus]RKD24465.1 hypothetical protein BEP19_08745 [Ammoniphilus oxalaticus]